jgi:hypothetical protein
MIRIVPTRFDKEEFLTRGQCAEFLRAQGLRMSERHLGNLGNNNNEGGGPPFTRTRWNKVWYSRADVIEWLKQEAVYVR